MESCDCLVIGAGFGGLGTALALAESGARVVLCEALRYPGGCASTFTRHGYAFEAGATLFSGFGPGQLFDTWIQRHAMAVETTAIDPIVELRGPGLVLPVPDTREQLVELFCRLPGAPVEGIRRFFARQAAVAETLWTVLNEPSLLPPFDVKALLRHAGRLGAYASLVPLMGRPLLHLLQRERVDTFLPLRLFVDAVCQITVQTSAAEAEAPFALSTLDYFFRGTRHVRGGIGELAWAMCRTIEKLGGSVRLADAVRQLRRTPSGWRVVTRRGEVEARTVVANVLPHDLQALLGEEVRELRTLQSAVEDGWGAVMLYLVIPAGVEAVRPEAHHVELIADAARPLLEGNHLFVSLSGSDEPRGRASLEDGQPRRRTVTVSTHVPLRTLAHLDDEERKAYIDAVQTRMRQTLALRAPELAQAVVFEMTASPRTFERFTRRRHGAVGGIPRRAGLWNYRSLSAPEVRPRLFLVGDSVFPGQSTLATAVGGTRVAARIARLLGR